MSEKKINRVKWYGILLGILYLAGQHGIYLLGHILGDMVGITPMLPKIHAVDDLIPIVSIFIIPYIWSYAYWAMGPMAVSKCDSKYFKDFMATCLFSALAGMVLLIFVPTYMNRVTEGLYEVRTGGIFEKLRLFWYSLDGSEMAYNLFPSFHCIDTTVVFLGCCGRKEIPKWFRIYSCVTMVLILLSTVFVKQHYFIDVIGGVAIGAIAYVICTKCHAGRIFDPISRIFEKKRTGPNEV